MFFALNDVRNLHAIAVAALVGAAGLGALMYMRVRKRAPDGDVTAGDVLEEIVITAQRIGEGVTESVRTAAGDLPRGIRNNNPGNIEWIDAPEKRWRGMVDRDGRYGIFDSMANGVRAIGGELRASIGKRQTVRAAIYEWAPPGENDSESYLTHVEHGAGVDADARLTARMIPGIARVIIEHENGGLFGITEQQVEAWVALS